MNFEELKNYLSTDALKIINKILNDNELNDIDKKNAFDIAWYLKNKSTHYYIHTESLIKLFFDVYMDKEIRNKSCFSKLLRIIKDEIQHAENPQYDNLIKDPSEYIKNQRNILFTKIYTVMIVAINIKYMNESDFFEIINKLLKSNLDFNQSQFINKIIENIVIKNDPQKLKIILEVSLKNKVNIETIMDYDLYQNIFNLLMNKDILILDNETYKKVIEIIIHKVGSYLLDNSLNKEELSDSKKTAIINYFNDMKNYYPNFVPYLSSFKEKQVEELMNIFNIVNSNRLLSMDDETYAKTLKDISNCNKPFSYVEIQANEHLTDEQRDFVSKLIKEGEVSQSSKTSLSNSSWDYKQELSHIATSEILLKFPIEEYKKLLNTFNEYCEKCEELDRKNNDNYYIHLWNKRYIAELFDKSELYLENKERLLFTIDEILSSTNRYLSEYIKEFATDKNSIYYNEEEYKKAIQLIKEAHYFLQTGYKVTKLFTNINIPFMEDKTSLFKIAKSTSESHIGSYIDSLNNLGRYNMNIYLMFDGVDESTIKLVTNNQPPKIKKIVRNNNKMVQEIIL